MAMRYLGTGLEGAADVGLATSIAARHFAATVGSIRTCGYAEAGIGAAAHVSDALATSALAAAHPRFCKQSADGRYWRLMPDVSGFISVTAGGATGNGSTDDYAAIQAALDYARTFGGATVYFPAGTYWVATTPQLTGAKGINLRGDGPDRSIISSGAIPAFKTLGYWRSVVEGLGFWCNGNTVGGAFELEGKPDGSFGVQGISFRNCLFFGNYNSKYVFTNQRIAGGYGQGSECTWIGCAFQGAGHNAGDALFMQSGNNALQNTLINCNLQGFITGVMIYAGNADILHCGFQSTYGYEQIANDGWDVDASYSSVGDSLTMTGCRTESLRIYRGGGPPAQISAFGHVPGGYGNWGASGAFASNTLIQGLTAAGNLKLYRATTAGTSSGTVPVWPESGAVSDGSVVWTQLDFNVFQAVSGRISRGQIQFGQIHVYQVNGVATRVEDVNVTRDDCFPASLFISGGDGPLCSNVRTVSGPTRAIKFGNNSNAGARNTDPQAYNFGNHTQVWTAGNGGGTYHDIAIGRAAGDFNYKGNNYFGLTGGWGFAQIAFAELYAVTRSGVVYFVIDGTPGSSPLTGGGTGCLAVRQSGAWSAVNLGDGLLSSNGTGKITLGNYPSIPAVTLVNSAGCTVGADSITCTAATGWGTAGAYSSQSYSGNVDLVARVTGTIGTYFFGLNSDPTTDDSYASVDYAIYVVAGSPSYVQVWQSGGAAGPPGPNIVDGDTIAIRRVGTTIEYLHNRTVFQTATGISVTTPLFFDSAFNSPGGALTNISFGPKAFNQPNLLVNGPLQLGRIAYSGLPILSVADGASIFVTDGTPSSSPLTGGGTGCFAVRQNGIWRALATGVQTIVLTGDVTGSGAGTFVATLANDAVTNAKLANVATSTIKGRMTAATGDPEDLSAAQVRTLLNVANGATANISDASLLARANHTGTQAIATIAASNSARIFGRVTAGAGTGEELTAAQAKTLLAIAPGDVSGLAAVATSGSASDLGVGTLSAARLPAHTGEVISSVGSAALSIANNAVTLGKLAQIATARFLGRITAVTGDPEAITGTQATSLLDLASGSAKGLIGSADFTKLAGVAAGATANSADATLLARTNHTGTQAVSTVLAAATSRFFGRLSASGGPGEELTGTQATSLLDPFSSSFKGLAPASGGGIANYLRADGAWVMPMRAGSSSVSLPGGGGVMEWTESFAAPGMTPAALLQLGLGSASDSDENDPDFLVITSICGVPGTDTITANLTFGEPTSGPIKLNWSAQ